MGDKPVSEFLASAPSRQGPWTPVSPDGLVPPDYTWLRISYPLPMQPGVPSPITPNQSTYRLYRGAFPELQRIAPADRSVRSVHRFAEIPGGLAYWSGAVRFHHGPGPAYNLIDLATGKVAPGQEPVPLSESERYRFPSPDGRLVAELSWHGEAPGWLQSFQNKKFIADLIISEKATGKPIVRYDNWLTGWGYYGCSNNLAPGFGWRADSSALAALDAPEQDRLVLKVADLKGGSRNLAEQKRQGAGFDQFNRLVVWAPSGSMIVFGSQVVEAATGRVVSEDLLTHAFWSPDSRICCCTNRTISSQTGDR